jgi:hypothetical protein
VVLESEPQAAAEHEPPAIVHDTGASPVSAAVILKDWPASIVMAEEERLVMPLPAYPPAPQPVNVIHKATTINNTAWPGETSLRALPQENEAIQVIWSANEWWMSPCIEASISRRLAIGSLWESCQSHASARLT